MSPGQAGRGRPAPDLDPHRGPLMALAWALFVLRPPRGHDGHRTLEEIGRLINYDKSRVSRLTNGKELPSLGPMRAYLAIHGVEDTGPWERLRDLAEKSGEGADELRRFAEAFVELGTTSLPEQFAAQQVGTAQDLLASWTPPAASTAEGDDSGSVRPGGQGEGGASTGEGGSGPGGSGTGGSGSGGSGTGGPGSGGGGGSRGGRAARIRWTAGLAAGLVVVVAAVTVISLRADGGGPVSRSPASQDSALAACRRPTAQLRIASSTDKSAILRDLAQLYGPRSGHGGCVTVVVDSVDSGIAMRALARGWNPVTDGPRPDVWAPAAQVWLQIARQRAAGKDALNLLPERAGPSIVTSPLTIAMPELIARRQGWPGERIGWKKLATMAEDGRLTLGKTNPEYSTSGLNATVAAFYTRTGTIGELVPSDLTDRGNQEKVRAIEKAVVHYGDTTLTFLANLRRADDAGHSTDYISAVTVEENSVVAYNEGYPCGSRSDEPGCAKRTRPRVKLVAFYPTDGGGVGTIYSDHPYIPLNGLPDERRAVAADFLHFLTTSKPARDRFAELGFRGPSHELTANITQENGALPDPLPKTLSAPPADFVDRLLTVWRQLRKPANVLVLIDTSGSMNWNAKDDPNRAPGEPSKLDLVKEAHGPLLDGFTGRDRVGLWHFSSRRVVDDDVVEMRARAADGRTHREHLEADIRTLHPEAATALYRTVGDAVKSLRDHYDRDAINAVVVLTDGRNETTGGPTLKELKRDIGDPRRPVRVFTIAYGGKADTGALRQIAEATHARAYEASDPGSIAGVLTHVISNF
ncbi:vWA domain-containing protein [Microbispora triticiradicis]|uniref:VWA domain-containing protein n=2 Tax=Microbispora TaxID=2005 RepID=A0ABY3M239_9ACTN|nr:MULTISPECIES: substrate-binding domain-containing protein [Microbispora]TLP57142.1 VWA domain-containing protein [Microbispora fusca]TYB64055.1 VWA domain-containing protein [Microbispora tritici]